MWSFKAFQARDPPWQQREWVTSPQGRKTYIGFELDCKTCGSPDIK